MRIATAEPINHVDVYLYTKRLIRTMAAIISTHNVFIAVKRENGKYTNYS